VRRPGAPASARACEIKNVNSMRFYCGRPWNMKRAAQVDVIEEGG